MTGITRSKLEMVTKRTASREMFEYLLNLLGKFALHQHNSLYQGQKFRDVWETLPDGHVAAIHDFSENFRYFYQFSFSIITDYNTGS